MINCQQARQLFDRYLDDELSPSLQAELHAHVLHCSPCQSRLAVLEACGDVIRLDKSEPVLTSSFTDRVMAARREQLASQGTAKTSDPITARLTGRRPSRRVFYVGLPLAAAASVAMVFWLGLPMTWQSNGPATVTAGVSQAAPKEFRANMTAMTDRKLDPQAQRELDATPEMEALPFLEAFVAPLVEGTRNAVEGTRRSYKDVELLLRYGFAGMNDRLVAEYHEKYQDAPKNDEAAARVASDLDFLNATLLNETLPAQQPSTPMAIPSDDESRGALPDAI